MNEDLLISELEMHKQLKAELFELCRKYNIQMSDIRNLADEVSHEQMHELKLRSLAMINLGITHTMMHEANFQQKEKYNQLIDAEVERIRK